MTYTRCLVFAIGIALALAGCEGMQSGGGDSYDRDTSDAYAVVNKPKPRPEHTAPPEKPLVERLGGEAGLRALDAEVKRRVSQDPALAGRFRTSTVEGIELRAGLLPSTGLVVMPLPALGDAEYDAFMRDVAAALDADQVGEREKVEVIALLAPLRKDVVAANSRPSTPGERGSLSTPTAEVRVALPPPGPALSADPWSPEEKALAARLIQRFGAARRTGAEENDDELIGRPLEQTRFVVGNGDVFDLADYRGKKKVVLVILRGFAGQVCLACSSQTVALARDIQRFRDAGAEVVVVYPGSVESLPAFLEAVRNLEDRFVPPFPVVLDVDCAAVKTFKIEGALAKPTSIVIDEQGVVRWAYVGKKPTDRPSAADLLAEVARISAKKP
jgi:peroxiredoxin